MKKSISIILCTALFLSLFCLNSFALLFGDVDFDGAINVSDARLALRGAVNLESWKNDSTDAHFIAADVDRDGSVTVSDARLILRCAVHLEDINQTQTVTASEFNEKVGALKNSLNSYLFSLEEKTVSYCGEASYSGGLKGIMKAALDKDIKEMMTEETSFGVPTFDRVLMKSNYFIKGSEGVSALTNEDKITITRSEFTGQVFGGLLPENITAENGSNYDISSISSFSGEKLEVLSVKIEDIQVSEKENAIDRVYGTQYRSVIEEISSQFNDINDISDKLSQTSSMTASATVSYFFDSETGAPVAAIYGIHLVIDFTMAFKGTTSISSGSFSIPIYFNTSTCCVFKHRQ